MDGVYPKSNCFQLPIECKNGQSHSLTGGTWASTAYIRNRGQTSSATEVYDSGWPDYLTNNPPPSLLYVRVAPSQYDANKLVYWINGWERPRLILTRGKKYQFNVNTCGQPFYLTNDPDGGNGAKGNITSVPPADFYVTTYTITPSMPEKFYYQSANLKGMGGEVLIKL